MRTPEIVHSRSQSICFRFCLSMAISSIKATYLAGNIAKLGSATGSIAGCLIKNISVGNLQAADYLSQASGGIVFEYTLFRICPLEEGSLKLGLPPSGLPPHPVHEPCATTIQPSLADQRAAHVCLHVHTAQGCMPELGRILRHPHSACWHPDQHDSSRMPLSRPSSPVQARGPRSAAAAHLSL